MGRKGFTLIELLTATALLTAALGMVWQVWFSAGHTAQVIEKKMATTTGASHALAIMRRELRQSSRASWSSLPAERLTYRIPEDRDGDGLPLDAAGAPELSEERALTRDMEDANGDGITASQLVLITSSGVVVLANNLDVLDADNPESVGLRFTEDGGGLQVVLSLHMKTRRDLELRSAITEYIFPRNP